MAFVAPVMPATMISGPNIGRPQVGVDGAVSSSGSSDTDSPGDSDLNPEEQRRRQETQDTRERLERLESEGRGTERQRERLRDDLARQERRDARDDERRDSRRERERRENDPGYRERQRRQRETQAVRERLERFEAQGLGTEAQRQRLRDNLDSLERRDARDGAIRQSLGLSELGGNGAGRSSDPLSAQPVATIAETAASSPQPLTPAQADSLNAWYDQGEALGETLREESISRTADLGLDATPAELQARGIGEYDVAGDSRYQEWVASRPVVPVEDTYSGQVLEYAQGLDEDEEDYLTDRQRILNRPPVEYGLSPGEAQQRYGARGAALAGLVDPNAPVPAATTPAAALEPYDVDQEETIIGTRRIITSAESPGPSAPVTDVDEFDPGALGEAAVRQRAVREFDQQTFDRDPLGRPEIVAREADAYQEQGRVLEQIREYDEATFARDPEGRRPGIVSSQAISPARFTAFSEAVDEQRQQTSPTAPLAIIEAEAEARRPVLDSTVPTAQPRPVDATDDDPFYMKVLGFQPSGAAKSYLTASAGPVGGIIADVKVADYIPLVGTGYHISTSLDPRSPGGRGISGGEAVTLGASTASEAAPLVPARKLITDVVRGTFPAGRLGGFGGGFIPAATPAGALPRIAGASEVVDAASLRLRQDLLEKGYGQVNIGGKTYSIREDRVAEAIRAANPDIPGISYHATSEARALSAGGTVPVMTRTGNVGGTPSYDLKANEIWISGKSGEPQILSLETGKIIPTKERLTIVGGEEQTVIKGAEEQFTFTSPGVAVDKFMIQSAYGTKGETSGLFAYTRGADDLAVPGPAEGVTKTYKGGFELEYGVPTGDTLPAARQVAGVGHVPEGGLYLPEDVAAPTYGQRFKANVGATVDTLTGQQRGVLRVDGVEGLSDDALARGIYGDDVVDAGLTARQQEYVQLSRLDDATLNARAADNPVAAEVAAARREGQTLIDDGARAVPRERVVGTDGTTYVYSRAGVLVPEKVDLPRSELAPEQYTGRLPDTPTSERVDARGDLADTTVTTRAGSIDQAGTPRLDGVPETDFGTVRGDVGEAPTAVRSEFVRGEEPDVGFQRGAPEEGVVGTPVTVRPEGEGKPPSRIIIPPPPAGGAGRIITRGEPPPPERIITDTPPPADRVTTGTPPPAEQRITTETPPPAERAVTGPPPPSGKRIIIPPPPTRTPPERGDLDRAALRPPGRRITGGPPPPPPVKTTRQPDPEADERNREEQAQLEAERFPRVVSHEETILDVEGADGTTRRVVVDVDQPGVVAFDADSPDGRPHLVGNQVVRADSKGVYGERDIFGEPISPLLPPEAAAEEHPEGRVETVTHTLDVDTGEKTVERYREPRREGETLAEQLRRTADEPAGQAPAPTAAQEAAFDEAMDRAEAAAASGDTQAQPEPWFSSDESQRVVEYAEALKPLQEQYDAAQARNDVTAMARIEQDMRVVQERRAEAEARAAPTAAQEAAFDEAMDRAEAAAASGDTQAQAEAERDVAEVLPSIVEGARQELASSEVDPISGEAVATATGEVDPISGDPIAPAPLSLRERLEARARQTAAATRAGAARVRSGSASALESAAVGVADFKQGRADVAREREEKRLAAEQALKDKQAERKRKAAAKPQTAEDILKAAAARIRGDQPQPAASGGSASPSASVPRETPPAGKQSLAQLLGRALGSAPEQQPGGKGKSKAKNMSMGGGKRKQTLKEKEASRGKPQEVVVTVRYEGAPSAAAAKGAGAKGKPRVIKASTAQFQKDLFGF